MTSILTRIARLNPASSGTLELPGGSVQWDDEGIVVEFEATTDFRVRPGNGSLQLSQTRVDGKPAVHLELRTRDGRLQLVSPTSGDALADLPEINARGATVPLKHLLELAAAAHRLDVKAAQVEAAALHSPDEEPLVIKKPPIGVNLAPDEDSDPIQKKRSRKVLAIIALVMAIFAVFVFWVTSGTSGGPATNTWYEKNPDKEPGVPAPLRDRPCDGALVRNTAPQMQNDEVDSTLVLSDDCNLQSSLDLHSGHVLQLERSRKLNGPENFWCEPLEPTADEPLESPGGPIWISDDGAHQIVFGSEPDTGSSEQDPENGDNPGNEGNDGTGGESDKPVERARSNTPLKSPYILPAFDCTPHYPRSSGVLVVEGGRVDGKSGDWTLMYVAFSGETQWAHRMPHKPLYVASADAVVLVAMENGDLYPFQVHQLAAGQMLWSSDFDALLTRSRP